MDFPTRPDHFGQALDKLVAAVGPSVWADGPEVVSGVSEAVDTGELTDATRDQLYQLVKQADIPGRSTMNKDQLIDALRQQRE